MQEKDMKKKIHEEFRKIKETMYQNYCRKVQEANVLTF